jgi:tetratricopeptide (TPR) repeat protein
VKYLLRRAGDFFDWKSGFFEFPADRRALASQIIEDADYKIYLKLDRAERTRKILQIRDLVDSPEIDIDQRVNLLREMGRLFESGREYEQAITSYDHAIVLKSDSGSVWIGRGDALSQLGLYTSAITAYRTAIRLASKNATSHYDLLIDSDVMWWNSSYRKHPGRFSKDQSAITTYETAMKLASQDASAHYNPLIAYSFDDRLCFQALDQFDDNNHRNPLIANGLCKLFCVRPQIKTAYALQVQWQIGSTPASNLESAWLAF